TTVMFHIPSPLLSSFTSICPSGSDDLELHPTIPAITSNVNLANLESVNCRHVIRPRILGERSEVVAAASTPPRRNLSVGGRRAIPAASAEPGTQPGQGRQCEGMPKLCTRLPAANSRSCS